MRLLLLWTLGLLGMAGAARGQELRGGYRFEPPKGRAHFGGSVYWFGDGRFRQSIGGCMGSQEDAGSFTRRGKLLTLYYDKWEQPASTFTVAPLSADSTQALEVIILDAQTRQPLQHIEVQNNRRQDALYLSNEAGRVKAEWPQQLTATDTVTISRYLNADYMPLRIPARLLSERHLTVLLAPKIQRQASGFIETFIIHSLTPKNLVLQFTDASLTAYMMRYSRLSTAETRLLFPTTN